MAGYGSRSSCRVVDRDGQLRLEDKLFGHLPAKLCSAKVAVRGCLLVDWPLKLQFPGGG